MQTSPFPISLPGVGTVLYLCATTPLLIYCYALLFDFSFFFSGTFFLCCVATPHLQSDVLTAASFSALPVSQPRVFRQEWEQRAHTCMCASGCCGACGADRVSEQPTRTCRFASFLFSSPVVHLSVHLRFFTIYTLLVLQCAPCFLLFLPARLFWWCACS